MKKWKICLTSGVVLALMLHTATGAGAEDLTETRTLRESIAVDSGSVRLIVDNVWGSITVRGYDGATVEMVAEETVRAKTAARIEEARREVELEILKRDGEVELYVNGPFRCQDRRDAGNCWNR